MPVPSSINDLSTTPGTNSPAGSENPNTFDDYVRTLSAFIAQLRDGKADSALAVLLSGNQTIAGVKTFSSTIVGNINGNAAGLSTALSIAGGGTGKTDGSNLYDTGDIKHSVRTTASAGWVKANGTTIGNASSGGTGRANADTEALFVMLWDGTTQATLPIQTSAGGASTRGANAAADFAANKRLPLPDIRAEALRGLDDGRGVDTSRANLSSQLDAMQGHYHSTAGYQATAVGSDYGSSAAGNTAGSGTLGPITDGTNGTPRTAAETRMRNVAASVYIKL